MFASKATLALYYFGAAYLVMLAWAAVLHDHINDASDAGRARTARRATACLVAGIAHPAFALAAWDIARQLNAASGDEEGGSSGRVGRLAPIVAIVSAAVAALIWSFVGVLGL